MPAEVEAGLRKIDLLRVYGPHAPDTVRRCLTSWSALTRWRGLAGFFSSPSLKTALRLVVRASGRPPCRKSAQAVTGDFFVRLLQTCGGDSLVDMQDRAILLTPLPRG